MGRGGKIPRCGKIKKRNLFFLTLPLLHLMSAGRRSNFVQTETRRVRHNCNKVMSRMIQKWFFSKITSEFLKSILTIVPCLIVEVSGPILDIGVRCCKSYLGHYGCCEMSKLQSQVWGEGRLYRNTCKHRRECWP